MINTVKNQTPERVNQWAAQQAYLVLGFILAACATAEIDTCPMEGFNPAQVDELLNLADKNLTAKIICPLGFRAASDTYSKMKKVRLSQNELFINLN